MTTPIRVAFDDPRNAGILRYLAGGSDPKHAPFTSEPPSVYNLERNCLGTHPELADRLWRGITPKLPPECGWVTCGSPTLVCPDSGIIFGFAGGTHTYALRLPEPARLAALARGAKREHAYSSGEPLHLDTVGEAWVLRPSNASAGDAWRSVSRVDRRPSQLPR